MARQGQNPVKWLDKVWHSQRITATTVVHLPSLDGYWKEGLQVLELCLWSMKESTGVSFDLMVLDNGSCGEVRQALLDYQKMGWIQFLILSRENLGKVGAWNLLFASAPGELVAFCDSDVYFMRDWLADSVRILEAFPEAGMVTGQPIAGGNLALSTNGRAVLQSTAAAHQGVLIPDSYLRAHLQAVGRPEDYAQRMEDRNDLLIERNGVRAYATASHFQFVTRHRVLDKIFPVRAKLPLGGDLQFDNEMVELGWWRLSTERYLVHHMGNRLPNLASEIPWSFEPLPDRQRQASRPQATPNPGIRVGNRYARSLLKKVNTLTWRLLYD